jgi:hypothetical protein
MTPTALLLVALGFSLSWLAPRVMRLPLRISILNLPVIFSILFLTFYALPYFYTEVVMGRPMYQWLWLPAGEKEAAALFLACYLAVFWLGFWAVSRRKRVAQVFMPERVNVFAIVIVLAAIPSLLVYIYATGGVESFLSGHREAVYRYQWSTEAEHLMLNRLRVMTNIVMMMAVIIGGYLAGTQRSAPLGLRVLYHLAPAPITLVKLALLSRGVFLFYLIFFVTKLVARNRVGRFFFLWVAVAAVAMALGIAGALLTRGIDEIGLSGAGRILEFMVLSLNGMSGFLDSVAISENRGVQGVAQVLAELSPVPSFLFKSGYDNNLSSLINGARSGSSAPMPFLGEVYYNLSWGGLVLGAAQGAWAGFIGNQLQRAEGRGWMVAFFIATLYSFIYMPHSGLRACTRPIVWIALLFGAKMLLWKLVPKKRRRAKESGGRLKTVGQQAAPF